MKQTRKKSTIILILSILILSFVFRGIPVSAATDMILVTDTDGDGSISVGDKFCLGEECFYILEDKDGSVKALAEYNLMTGYNIHYFAPDSVLNDFFDDGSREYFEFLSEHNFITCEAYFNTSIDLNEYYCYEPVSVDLNWEYFGDNPDYLNLTLDEESAILREKDYCYTKYEMINGSWRYYVLYCVNPSRNNQKIKQSPLAKSAHGDERGQMEYPEIGDHFFSRTMTNYLYTYPGMHSGDSSIYYDENNELIRDTYSDYYGDNQESGYGNDTRMNYIYEPIYEYKENLLSAGFNISDVDLLSYNDLADFLTAVNDGDMTFEHNGYGCDNWYQTQDGAWACDTSPWVWYYETRVGSEYGYSSVLDYVPDDYDWIYSSSYWLKTGFWNNFQERYTDANYQFFVDSLGDLCFVSNRSVCDLENIGAGIRPIVKIAEDELVLNAMNIEGVLRWNDDGNAHGARPSKTKINLYRNGQLIDSVEIEGDADEDAWMFSFPPQPKYDDEGNEFVYSIKPDDIDKYSSVIDNFDVVSEYLINPSTDAASIAGYAAGGVVAIIGLGVIVRRRR